MLKQALAATLLSLVFAATTSAQTYFLPVQSQYRTDGATYYYGGSDPRVHEYADRRTECYSGAGMRHSVRTGRYGTGYLHRGLISRPPQTVFSDCAPYLNAIVYGYTAVDARNESYARVPQFFRMSDLLQSAAPLDDGTARVVPPQAPGTIDIRPSDAASTRPTTTNPAEPKAILIIPKKQPIRPEPDSTVTDAR